MTYNRNVSNLSSFPLSSPTDACERVSSPAPITFTLLQLYLEVLFDLRDFLSLLVLC